MVVNILFLVYFVFVLFMVCNMLFGSCGTTGQDDRTFE